MRCYADTEGEWHAIGAALRGNAAMAAAHAELLEGYVDLFVEIFGPRATLSRDALRLASIGLIGAAEALSAAMVRGEISEAQATETFADMIVGTLGG